MNILLSLSPHILICGTRFSPPVRVRAHSHGRLSYSGSLSFILYISFISCSQRLLSERLQYSGLNHFLTALSTNMSINCTARAVRPSLREPSRAEWRVTNLFLSANKKPNYNYYYYIRGR